MTAPLAVRTTRDLVTATGPETMTFLQGQLSQDVASLAPAESRWSFLLQPQGKVDAWLRVHRVGHEELQLDVDPGFGAAVVTRLERFKLRTKCALTLAEGVPVLAIRGTDVEGGLPSGWPGIAGVDLIGSDAVDLGPGDELLPGIDEGDADAMELLRVRCGVPRMGAELTESTIPAEVGQWIIDASVSFTKGCFTGQELVARIDSRGGNVPRLLRAVESEQPLALGTELRIGDKVVGRVTSVAGVTALAYVHRSVEPPTNAQVGADASGGRVTAAIRALPLPG